MLAKQAEAAGRSQDTVRFLHFAFRDSNGDDLSKEDRNLLSASFKQLAGPLRTAWSAIRHYTSADSASCVIEYQGHVKGRMLGLVEHVCREVIEPYLGGSKHSDIDHECTAFFAKIQGDFWRYGAEVTEVTKENRAARQAAADKYEAEHKTPSELQADAEAQGAALLQEADDKGLLFQSQEDTRHWALYQQAIAENDQLTAIEDQAKLEFKQLEEQYVVYRERARASYLDAFELCQDELPAWNPLRLSVGCNLSVFYSEIGKDKLQAMKLAKRIFDDAVPHLDTLDGQAYKDADDVMVLIKDNLTRWANEPLPDPAEASAPGGHVQRADGRVALF